jgi:hypothetical protein
MWELRYKLSHGRLSMRRISLLATTLVMALFLTTLSFTETALAADATRNGASVSYDNKTFTELKSSDKLPSGLPAGTSGYEFVDTTGNKTYFILTSGTPSQASSGQYVYYDGLPTSNFSNPSPPKTVSIANGGPNSLESTAGSSTTCDGSLTNGIGWILCPVVNFLASGMDHLYEILTNFLEVRPVQTDTSSSLYRMWAIVRDLANICFVIAFLVIVYSQVTSIGMSNYNIKRMLPRLIAAAVLVNVSYWISSLAVDLSNLLGYSIHDLFMGMFKSLNTAGQYKEVKWADLTTFILSGGTIGALAAVGGYAVLSTGLGASLILLIPTLVGVLVAALIAFLVLAVRQALVVCLVIVSPLAFVAYLLPNTEKYFEKWKDLFLTMLLLFPIFSVIFGASQLAGLAIIQNANSLIMIIIGMAVMIAPVVVTPLLVKFSGGLVGRIAGMVNNPTKGMVDRSRNWAQGRAQEEKAKVLAGAGRNTWANRRTIGIDRRRRNREGWKKAYETMADNNFSGTEQGQALEARTRQSNIDKQRIDNAFGRTAVGRQLEYQNRLTNVDKQRVENEFNDSHYGHAADRANRTVDLAKHRIESGHEANWNTALRTDTNLMRENMTTRASQVRAELAKGQVERLNAEVAAQGENTEYILNLTGISTQQRDGLLKIARDIQTDTAVETYTSMAKNVADHKRDSVFNEMMLKNSMTIEGKTTREYASGIGSQDEVLATAVAKDRKEFGEAEAAQKELSNHFKLNAGEIERLAMDSTAVIVKTDDDGNAHTFRASNPHTHDMAADEIFTVGSHGQKMALLKSTGVGQPNYEYRRTIQQAAIKSGIGSIAPAINDKTLDDIINGRFVGDESWQYHSYRQILEGRIKANTLATANAESLKMLFETTDANNLTRTQFNQLITDNVPAELAALRVTNPTATDADARRSLMSKFDAQRFQARRMAAQVLSNPTIRQSANSQSVEVLKQFAGDLYQGE